MKILISGAGPAGLTAAYWLKKYGFTPTLIELAPELPTGGYKLDVRGSATQILRGMGIYDDVVKASTDMKGAQLVDKNGKVIHEMSGDAFGHRSDDDLEIMRSNLSQILLSKIPDVEIIYNDEIQGITQTDDKVNVDFKKHKSRSFDLIIGADGVHSRVRRIAFGDESNFSQKLGVNLSVFTIQNYPKLEQMEMQYTELGRAAVLWRTRGDTDARASFAFVSPNNIDRKNIVAQQKLIGDVFKGIGGEIPYMLEMMSKAPDFFFDEATQIRMDHWSAGRVVLLGDAGFCPSPFSGQGLSLALIGAYVLAGELAAANGNHRLASEKYEKELRHFVSLNQKLGLDSALLFRSQEKKNLFNFLLGKVMNFAPGWVIAYFINRATARIKQVANDIKLKDYSEYNVVATPPLLHPKAEKLETTPALNVSKRRSARLEELAVKKRNGDPERHNQDTRRRSQPGKLS